jgi:1-acyl-sn-glycerol-3-phosphate acyltransferase
MSIYRIALKLMNLLGWRFVGQKPEDAKFVLLGAPHTTNWDFILTLALIGQFDLPLRFFVKDSVFKGPWGSWMKSLGATPIDRSRRVNVVERTIAAFQEHDRIVIGILPEGTRKRTEHWKSGFYHIAYGAGVPVVLAKVDGAKKSVELGPRLMLTGDRRADMAKIAAYYEGVVAIYPDCFGPVQLKPGEEDQSSPDSAAKTE